MFEFLLFDNESQADMFQNIPENPLIYENLHLNIIENKLCTFSEHFPVRYFRKMHCDAKLAEYRNQIFREIGTAVSVKQIEHIFSQTKRWENLYNEACNSSHPLQRRFMYVWVLSSYFDLIDTIIDFLSEFSSEGIQKMCDFFTRYLETPSICHAKSAANNAKHMLMDNLHISLCVDFSRKHLTLSPILQEVSADLDELDSLCNELTQIKVLEEISVICNESFTEIEKEALIFVLEKNEQLRECIDHIPQISFMLDEVRSLNQQLAFYYAYYKLVFQLSEKGIPFCFPTFDKQSVIRCTDLYDISLSISKMENLKFVQTGNDITLSNEFQGFVLTGANQGGKTTYLRSVGLVVYLAMMGFPVACRNAVLYPFKTIVCLFCGEEVQETTLSRFEREIKQYLSICDSIDEDTIVLLNEYFSGTNRQDAVKILQSCIDHLLTQKAIFGCVTHFQEVYNLLGESCNRRIIYLRAEVIGDELLRTYRINQAIPDGRAYSETITARYGLTYKDLSVLFQENQKKKSV